MLCVENFGPLRSDPIIGMKAMGTYHLQHRQMLKLCIAKGTSKYVKKNRICLCQIGTSVLLFTEPWPSYRCTCT